MIWSSAGCFCRKSLVDELHEDVERDLEARRQRLANNPPDAPGAAWGRHSREVWTSGEHRRVRLQLSDVQSLNITLVSTKSGSPGNDLRRIGNAKGEFVLRLASQLP